MRTLRHCIGFCFYISAEILHILAESITPDFDVAPTEADIDRALKEEGWTLIEDDFDPLTARKIELEILYNKK